MLPATTPLERDDLMLNRPDPVLLYMSQRHAPLGQARDDYDVFADIAEQFGQRDAFTENRSTEAWLRYLWDEAGQVAQAHGFSLPAFDMFRETGRFDVPGGEDARYAFKDFVADPEAHPLATETGKLTLAHQGIAAMDLADCPGHPAWIPPIEGAPLEAGQFHLISGQPDTRLHGQNDQGSVSLASKRQGREVATLHPDAAAQIGVAAGDIVKLSSPRGACLCAVGLSDQMRVDCISLPTGAWYDPQEIDGEVIEVHGNPNALTIDKGCSSLSQGTMAHTCVVRAEAWTAPLPPLSITHPPRID